jgi:hypothetical protein
VATQTRTVDANGCNADATNAATNAAELPPPPPRSAPPPRPSKRSGAAEVDDREYAVQDVLAE